MNISTNIKRTYKRTLMSTALAFGLATASISGFAGEYKDDAHDAWLNGKLETSYIFNRHLNNFTIDTSVNDSIAYLSGTVESDIDRALAEEIAMNIKGITKVENNLVVDRNYEREMKGQDDTSDRPFKQVVADATTTAEVKTKLLANEHTDGLDINVDTRNGVVTLTGDVQTSEERMLAGKIAENNRDVMKVVNNLQIRKQISQK